MQKRGEATFFILICLQLVLLIKILPSFAEGSRVRREGPGDKMLSKAGTGKAITQAIKVGPGRRERGGLLLCVVEDFNRNLDRWMEMREREERGERREERGERRERRERRDRLEISLKRCRNVTASS